MLSRLGDNEALARGREGFQLASALVAKDQQNQECLLALGECAEALGDVLRAAGSEPATGADQVPRSAPEAFEVALKAYSDLISIGGSSTHYAECKERIQKKRAAAANGLP